MHALTMNSDLMEQIAEYLPTFDALAAYLEAFEDNPCLDNMQGFHRLPDDIDKADVWPELRIREVEQIDAFAALTAYVKRVYTHCFVDAETLRQILSPHNVLIIECVAKNEDFDELPLTWIDQMAQLPIAEIEMCGMDIGPLVQVLPRMFNLQKLVVEYCTLSLTDDFYNFIAESRLTRLSFVEVCGPNYHRTNLDNRNLNQLTQWLSNQPVIEFQITHCDLSADQEVVNKFYDALWSCNTLKECSCFSTEFPRFAVDRISRPIQWRSLNVGECEINDEMVRVLASGLLNSNVESLSLQRNGFSSESMEVIMSSLAQSKVSFVSFAGCQLLLPDLEIISKYLRSTKLRKLYLSCNDISAAGIEVLMPAVAQSQLEELDLTYGCIDNDAAKIITKTLPSTKLTRLNLNDNAITDEGAQYFADAIEKSPHLREISLANNYLTLQGVEHLVKKLTGRAPTYLNVYQNDFSVDSAEVIELVSAMSESAASRGHTLEFSMYNRNPA
ncbi:hypothetical protein AeNC1_010582 [Aphanomyces euteiches]|nr:hypothetical protein AeNC1_010582 [Aphanomyces euteiches]